MVNWYCIYTKPKKEEGVEKMLKEYLNLEVFNPKVKRKKLVKGRYIYLEEELFPCYIFSRFDPKRHLHTIRYTRGVRKIVGEKSPYVVDDSIIEAIKSRMVGGFVRLQPKRFLPGERVLIKEGPFKGVEGIFLEELSSKERVIILLNLIKYQARVKIGRDCLEKL